MAYRATLVLRSLIITVAAVILSGCGFRPVYGDDGRAAGAAGANMSLIDVAIIPNRNGQLLRQALQQRLDHGDALAKQYQLTVNFSVAAAPVGFQEDSSLTRIRQFATASWYLRSLDPAQTLVTSGVARSLDGVDIIDQQYFASDVAGETVQRRIADNVANVITLQLATYFNHRHALARG